ncbi:hypothetical protein KAU33_02885 [Candidatus Dependentiae bacterium]|nr:hypothetical protein [Candidatus Dependentiae bacterium]
MSSIFLFYVFNQKQKNYLPNNVGVKDLDPDLKNLILPNETKIITKQFIAPISRRPCL